MFRITCAQIVDMVYLEGWFFRTFRSVLLRSMQHSLPAAMQPHTVVKFEASIPATEVGAHHPCLLDSPSSPSSPTVCRISVHSD